MKKFISSDCKSVIARGSVCDISDLKQLLYSMPITSWEITYKLNVENTSRKIEAITADGCKTISYDQYRDIIKKKSKHDFIYDAVTERYYRKTPPRPLSAGKSYRANSIITFLANSHYPEASMSIAEGTDYEGKNPDALVRQVIKRINEKFYSDLIMNVGLGYKLNPQYKWLVLIEKV